MKTMTIELSKKAKKLLDIKSNKLFGWGLLIVVPIVIIVVSSLTFGKEIVDAIKTATLSNVIK